MTWSTADIPDLTGRRALVTGATSGLGYETALELLRHGADVLIAARNPAEGDQAARNSPRSSGREPDGRRARSGRSDQCREGRRPVTKTYDKLDLLVNNAGVMATPYRQTADGFELQLGTNHLGHFALTGRLLPVVAEGTGPARGDRQLLYAQDRSGDHAGGLPARRRSGYRKWDAYGKSKLANLLFMLELDRRARAAGVQSAQRRRASWLRADPPTGGRTGAGRASSSGAADGHRHHRLFAQSAAAGAWPSLYAATKPELRPGSYSGPGFFEYRGAPKLGAAHPDSAGPRARQAAVGVVDRGDRSQSGTHCAEVVTQRQLCGYPPVIPEPEVTPVRRLAAALAVVSHPGHRRPGRAEADQTAPGFSTSYQRIPGAGGIELGAVVLTPTGQGDGPFPLVVMPSSWGVPNVEYVGQGTKLATAGFQVISYSSRGFWDSGGGIDIAGPPTVADVSKVIDWADRAHPGRHQQGRRGRDLVRRRYVAARERAGPTDQGGRRDERLGRSDRVAQSQRDGRPAVRRRPACSRQHHRPARSGDGVAADQVRHRGLRRRDRGSRAAVAATVGGDDGRPDQREPAGRLPGQCLRGLDLPAHAVHRLLHPADRAEAAAARARRPRHARGDRRDRPAQRDLGRARGLAAALPDRRGQRRRRGSAGPAEVATRRLARLPGLGRGRPAAYVVLDASRPD